MTSEKVIQVTSGWSMLGLNLGLILGNARKVTFFPKRFVWIHGSFQREIVGRLLVLHIVRLTWPDRLIVTFGYWNIAGGSAVHERRFDNLGLMEHPGGKRGPES